MTDLRTQLVLSSGIEPYYSEQGIQIYHGDCREILPQLQGIQIVLTDPPYGGGLSHDYARRFRNQPGGWWGNTDRTTMRHHEPIYGDNEPFDPSHLIGFERVILWGANWYASQLPDSGGWLVWDKRRGIEDIPWPMSEAELAWTNINKGVRVFRYRWFGLIRDGERGEHYHPTQKPVALMRWCLERVPADAPIADPYMGSGPTLVAAKQLGRAAVGIEIEERYCEVAAERLRQGVLEFG